MPSLTWFQGQDQILQGAHLLGEQPEDRLTLSLNNISSLALPLPRSPHSFIQLTQQILPESPLGPNVWIYTKQTQFPCPQGPQGPGGGGSPWARTPMHMLPNLVHAMMESKRDTVVDSTKSRGLWERRPGQELGTSMRASFSGARGGVSPSPGERSLGQCG